MNTHRNRLLRSVIVFLPGALILAMTLLTGCDKSDRTAGIVDMPDTNTQYTLLPPAISIEPFGGGSPATRASLAMKEERQAFNTGEELGNIITLGNSEAEDTPQTRAFTNGTYYRIVVYALSEYNATSPNIHAQRLCKTGQTAYVADKGDSTEPIYLYAGDYRIFCYSFNKTSADKLDKLADGAVNVPISDGDDFLSSDIISKSIVSSQIGANVTLGTITLKHRCCRLTGTLTTELFESTGIGTSPTPSLSVTSTFNTSGKWSIKSTAFSGSVESYVERAIPLSKSGDTYTGTVFLLPLSGKSLTASYTFKPNGSSQNVTASDKSISSTATFSGGGSYSFTIKAVGAYVLTETNPVQIGSYKWAYANLNGSNRKMETYPWVSGKLNGNDNDYWRWNTISADTSTDYPASPPTWSTSTDPCRSGLGTSWKVPPKTYFDNLVDYILVSKRVYINGVTVTTNTHGWVNSGTVVGCVFLDASRGTCMFLPAVGLREGSSYYSGGSVGCYWSATYKTSETNYAYYLYFRTSYCYISQYYTNNGLSLRCVQ